MLSNLLALTRANRVVKLEGPNGSGKSTLLVEYQVHLARNGLGFGVYSQHESVFEELTGNELFAISGLVTAGYWLQKLDGEAAIHKRLSVMSSGEKSKVLLALALCADIVVLDEPLSHLDQTSRKKLQSLVAESDSLFVIANHEPGAFPGATLLELASAQSPSEN